MENFEQLLKIKNVDNFETYIANLDSLEISKFFDKRDRVYAEKQLKSVHEAAQAWENLESFYRAFRVSISEITQKLFTAGPWSGYAAQEIHDRWKQQENWIESTHKDIQRMVTGLKKFATAYGNTRSIIISCAVIENFRNSQKDRGFFGLSAASSEGYEQHYKYENMRAMMSYYRKAQEIDSELPLFKPPQKKQGLCR